MTKSLERKHEMLMKSIGEVKEVLKSTGKKMEETPQEETEKSVQKSQEHPSEAIGTFSQCYDPSSSQLKSSPLRSSDIKISFEDILTDPNTKDLWRKYFSTEQNVDVDLFTNCVFQEFKDLLTEDDDINNKARELLKEHISLDGIHVSLNALQIFTKEDGLNNALKELILNAAESHQEELASEQRPKNEEILSEIEGVKKMLDEKHKALIKKDQTLREKELILEQQQDKLMSKIQGFANTQFKAIEATLKKICSQKSKQLESIEQMIENKIATYKRLKSKGVQESAAKLKQSQSFQLNEEITEEKFKKQKQRISSLEQMYKEIKAKSDSLNIDLDREKSKNSDLQKQLDKYKNLCKIQEQKLQRLQDAQSISQISEKPSVELQTPKTHKNIINPKTTAQKENENEEQKNIRKSEKTGIVATASQKQENVGQVVTVTEHIGSKEASKTYTSLINTLIKSLRKSLPHYISVYQEELRGEKNSVFKIKIGELLYPSMPEILPEIVDSVHLAINSPPENMLTLLEVAWETVNFAFETQIFSDSSKSCKSLLTKSIEYKSGYNILKKIASQPESLKKDSKTKTDPESSQLPLYPLFTNENITKTFVKDVDSLCGDIKKPVLQGKSKGLKTGVSRMEILCSLLGLLLTNSEKRAKQALLKLKYSITDDNKAKEICEYRGISVIAMASTIQSVSSECIGIFLSLSIDHENKAEFYKQLSTNECVQCLMSAFENSIENHNITQQEDLIVLLHKLFVTCGAELDKAILEKTRNTLENVLQNTSKEDRRFFISNVESLVKHLNNLNISSINE